MPIVRKVISLVDLVSTSIGVLAGVMIAAIAAIILAEIVTRTFFGFGLKFTWEYITYLNGMAIFCGAAFTLRTGGHIRVSLLRASVSPAVATWADIACTVIGLFIATRLALALWQLAYTSHVEAITAATPLETPLAVPQGAVAAGATLFALQLAMRLLSLLVGERAENAPPDDRHGAEA